MNFLKKKFGEEAFDTLIQQGRETLLLVRVDFHAIYGMKLIVHDIDPRVTIGQLEMERLKTLERLTKEKRLHLNKQVASPPVWQRIAVISSDQAAGYVDFINQLNSNGFGYSFTCELFNASMQGVHVVKTVCEQIRLINDRASEFDAIVIVRGGGAKLDLAGFDQYEICKEISRSVLPVLSGIGHEIDHVLVDQVAHSSSKTPTAAAEFLIDRMLRYENNIITLYKQIQKQIIHQFRKEELKIEQIFQHIRFTLSSAFKSHYVQLDAYEKVVDLLDPHKILNRGYSAVVNPNGELVKKLTDLDKNEQFTLHMSDGKKDVTIQ